MMHGKGDYPENVQHHFIETFQQRNGRVWNFAEVREIGGTAKAETQNFHFPVQQGHGDKRDAEKFNGAPDGFERNDGHGTESRLVVKNEGNNAPEISKRIFISVIGQRFSLSYLV